MRANLPNTGFCRPSSSTVATAHDPFPGFRHCEVNFAPTYFPSGLHTIFPCTPAARGDYSCSIFHTAPQRSTAFQLGCDALGQGRGSSPHTCAMAACSARCAAAWAATLRTTALPAPSRQCTSSGYRRWMSSRQRGTSPPAGWMAGSGVYEPRARCQPRRAAAGTLRKGRENVCGLQA